MAQYIFGIAAESATVDGQSNQLSIFKVIENVNLPILPAVFPKMTLIIMLARDNKSKSDEKISGRLVLNPGQSHNSISRELDVVIPKGKQRVRAIVDVFGIPIEKDGDNAFVFQVKKGSNWEELGRIPFEVLKIKSPQQVTGLNLNSKV